MLNRLQNLKMQKCKLYPQAELVMVLSFLYPAINSVKSQYAFVWFFISMTISIFFTSMYNGMFVKQFYLLPLSHKGRERIVIHNYSTRIIISLLFYIVGAIILSIYDNSLLVYLIIEGVIYTASICVFNTPMSTVSSTALKKISAMSFIIYRLIISYLNMIIASSAVSALYDLRHNNSDFYEFIIIAIFCIMSVILTIVYFKKYFRNAVFVQADYETITSLLSE